MKNFASSLLVISLIMIMISNLLVSEAVWINLPSTGSKCVSEEIHNHVVVVGDFVVIDDSSAHGSLTVSAKVTSPYGNTMYHEENVTHSQFAFTTSEAGSYVACFWVEGNHQTATLNLDWKTGIAAKDWDAVAKIEHIEGVELELTKLEGAVEDILDNLIYLKNREAELREVSEKTNARVAWYSIMSIAVGILASIFQVWHLTSYFQKKKLI